jgi:hypothetical protein
VDFIAGIEPDAARQNLEPVALEIIGGLGFAPDAGDPSGDVFHEILVDARIVPECLL